MNESLMHRNALNSNALSKGKCSRLAFTMDKR